MPAVMNNKNGRAELPRDHHDAIQKGVHILGRILVAAEVARQGIYDDKRRWNIEIGYFLEQPRRLIVLHQHHRTIGNTKFDVTTKTAFLAQHPDPFLKPLPAFSWDD
ncbi:hypothetical protein D3C87_1971050 [compost metagenome]